MARTPATGDIAASRQRKYYRQREEEHHQGASVPAVMLTQMRRNSHLLVLREIRQQRQAIKRAAAFLNSSSLAKWVGELQDEKAELESYRQALRAVMNLNRQKRQGRENHLAAIPESDCEE